MCAKAATPTVRPSKSGRLCRPFASLSWAFRFHSDVGLHKPACLGIVVKDLSVASPIERGIQLASDLRLGEVLIQHVVKELFLDGMVRLRAKRAIHCTEQCHVV